MKATQTIVKHLDHLNLTVRSLDETIDWYRRVFGFEPMERDVQEDDTPWAVLRSGDSLLCVYERPDLERLDRHEARARGLHFINHFGLRITDAAGWEETVKRERVEVEYGGAIQYPHSTSWYVSDPTGYEIEVACWDDDQVRF